MNADDRRDVDSPVDLRCETPRYVVDVIDAVSFHRRIKRQELINEILAAWCDDKVREVTLVMRVTASGKGGDR